MPQLKSKKFLFYFFLFLMIGSLNNKNIKDLNFLQVDKISIKGLDEKNNFQIKEDLNFLKFKNLFFLDKERIKEIIDTNNLVESYSIFKIYPSRVEIELKKTNFLAQIKKKNINFVLGSNGKFIKVNDPQSDMPYIFGDFQVENFFDLKTKISETQFNYKDVKSFFFFKSGRWDIETKDGLLIKLPKNEIKKSLELITRFLNENDINKIYKIDLRQNKQIIING